MLDTTRSEEAFRIACRVIPGGVDSPVRAARAVGRNPVFLARGEGAHVWDVDGNARPPRPRRRWPRRYAARTTRWRWYGS